MANQKETKQIQARKKRREAIKDYTFNTYEKAFGIVTIFILLLISIYTLLTSIQFSKRNLTEYTITILNQPKLETWTGKGATTRNYEFYSREFNHKFIIVGHAYNALNKTEFTNDIHAGDTAMIEVFYEQKIDNDKSDIRILGIAKNGKQYISLTKLNQLYKSEAEIISIVLTVAALLILPLAYLTTKKKWNKYHLFGFTIVVFMAAIAYCLLNY